MSALSINFFSRGNETYNPRNDAYFAPFYIEAVVPFSDLRFSNPWRSHLSCVEKLCDHTDISHDNAWLI